MSLHDIEAEAYRAFAVLNQKDPNIRTPMPISPAERRSLSFIRKHLGEIKIPPEHFDYRVNPDSRVNAYRIDFLFRDGDIYNQYTIYVHGKHTRYDTHRAAHRVSFGWVNTLLGTIPIPD